MLARLLPLLLAAACNGDKDDGDTTGLDADADADADSDADADTDADTDADSDADTDADTDAISCEVAIIGGGVGGLHTAYRLAPTLGDGVCVFEKEAELGGRIKDVALDESDPASPRVGVGARRVMEGQDVLFGLAEELGIEFEVPGGAADLISARGGFAFAKDDLLPYYPEIPADPEPDVDTETYLYDQLRFGALREDVDEHPDFRSYIQAAVGFEEYQFLRDMSRFRADFEYPLDARGYLDYLDEEWDVCCTASYPVGGMSQFTVGMQAEAEAAGARIYTQDAVASIDRDGDAFRLVTADHVVTAQKVVIAIPPSALDWVEGDVADDIRAQQAYQDIVGVKVVTITQWWPNSWWETVQDPEGTPIWRAWTTEHCLTFIEIPQEPYAADQHVTRSVYNDNRDCSIFWEGLAEQGTDAVEAEVKRGLEYLFVDNGITTDAVIPDPVKTHVQVWESGWHWLGAGASVTNAELYEWAAEPLPGEEVGLVGEAYNVQRSGWSDGAYKSSINLLNTRYGMDL